MAKILIIEDDPYISEELRAWLLSEQHIVDLSSAGEDGLYRLQQCEYDLSIVDWNLPEIQGVDICRKIHSLKPNLPLLMLTSRADLVDRIRGLDSGAMDYIVKPCELPELSARIRSLLRRLPEQQDNCLPVFDLLIQPESRTVRIKDSSINLSPTEFDILLSLARSKKEGLDYKALAASLDKQPIDVHNSIKTLILRLRKKLAQAGSRTAISYEQTIGYSLRESDE